MPEAQNPDWFVYVSAAMAGDHGALHGLVCLSTLLCARRKKLTRLACASRSCVLFMFVKHRNHVKMTVAWHPVFF
jgi:hypothetical protein